MRQPLLQKWELWLSSKAPRRPLYVEPKCSAWRFSKAKVNNQMRTSTFRRDR
jgi:hypothetical protein